MSADLQRPPAARRRMAGEALEDWLSTLFQGHKSTYLQIVLAAVCVVTVLLVIPLSAFLCFAVAVPASGIPPLMGVVLIASVITAPPLIVVIFMRRHRQVFRWLAGGDEDPVDVWRSMVVDMPVSVAIIDFVCGLGAAVPGFWAARKYLAAEQGIAVLAALAIGITFLGSLAFWLLVLEIVWRPLAKEVGAHLPSDFTGSGMGRSMRSRLFWITLMLVLFTGIAVGDLSTLANSYSQRLFFAVTGTVLVAVSVSGLLSGLLRHSILSRIEALRDALDRVRQGNFDVKLVPLAGDEMDDVGESFNEMVGGLAERERLHSAFGSYVDPALAERLLAQGDDLFQGEKVEVTVFFADVRDFTTYSEVHSPEESVARLNELFTLTVPILLEHGGHANKFLGDGVLAVFGVPNKLDDHADSAIDAAIAIQHKVRRQFGDELRIGIGINTGPVIAGTIGGGGKLEFTLIGDTVNVAARIEELTKTTGDPILIAESTRQALTRPVGASDRGRFDIRGRSEQIALHALSPW